MSQTNDNPVLLYDGVCGVCNKSVQMILRHDRRGTMQFAALQSEYGQAVINRHPQLRGIDSVVYLDRSAEDNQEQVFIRSSAALRIVSYLGGPWCVFLIGYVIPRPIRDFFYDLFARYRYRIFGTVDSCMLPTPQTKARFLDTVSSTTHS